MKQLLIAAALTFSLLAPPLALAVETKRVCVDQTDPKTKQVKQVCKDIKVHQKLDGTPVPQKPAK